MNISACQVIFANRTQGPLGSLGVQGSVNQAFDFKAECYANKSLLQAASNLGLVNSTSSNLTAQTENKLNEQDFSALTTWSSS